MTASKNQTVMLIDDDSLLIAAIADQLRMFLSERGLGFLACTSVDEVRSLAEKPEDRKIIIAIVDLWMIDKKSNTPNRNAGIEVIELLRQLWPRCYVIVYSAHIDANVRRTLEEYENVAIIEKPVPTFMLEDVLNKLLEGMGVCQNSGSARV